MAKIALITGAGSGIGKSSALALARVGFDVDRRPEAALTNRDGAIYTEDAFEMFFAPTSGDRFYQFIVSAAGTRFDADYQAPNTLGNVQWNAQWQAATARADGG